jgi:hypothetical protein
MSVGLACVTLFGLYQLAWFLRQLAYLWIFVKLILLTDFH